VPSAVELAAGIHARSALDPDINAAEIAQGLLKIQASMKMLTALSGQAQSSRCRNGAESARFTFFNLFSTRPL